MKKTGVAIMSEGVRDQNVLMCTFIGWCWLYEKVICLENKWVGRVGLAPRMGLDLCGLDSIFSSPIDALSELGQILQPF